MTLAVFRTTVLEKKTPPTLWFSTISVVLIICYFSNYEIYYNLEDKFNIYCCIIGNRSNVRIPLFSCLWVGIDSGPNALRKVISNELNGRRLMDGATMRWTLLKARGGGRELSHQRGDLPFLWRYRKIAEAKKSLPATTLMYKSGAYCCASYCGRREDI